MVQWAGSPRTEYWPVWGGRCRPRFGLALGIADCREIFNRHTAWPTKRGRRLGRERMMKEPEVIGGPSADHPSQAPCGLPRRGRGASRGSGISGLGVRPSLLESGIVLPSRVRERAWRSYPRDLDAHAPPWSKAAPSCHGVMSAVPRISVGNGLICRGRSSNELRPICPKPHRQPPY